MTDRYREGHYELDEWEIWSKEPEAMSVGKLNRLVRVLREEVSKAKVERQGYREGWQAGAQAMREAAAVVAESRKETWVKGGAPEISLNEAAYYIRALPLPEPPADAEPPKRYITAADVRERVRRDGVSLTRAKEMLVQERDAEPPSSEYVLCDAGSAEPPCCGRCGEPLLARGGIIAHNCPGMGARRIEEPQAVVQASASKRGAASALSEAANRVAPSGEDSGQLAEPQAEAVKHARLSRPFRQSCTCGNPWPCEGAGEGKEGRSDVL